jgi:ABC-2 type transport system permease protein
MDTSTEIKPVPQPKQWRFFNRILDNPVIMKELRGRMRDRRTFILLTAYLSLIGLFVAVVYLFMYDTLSYTRFEPGFRQTMGKAIFGTVIMIELLLISFIGPGLTAGSITSERERQTYDLLKTTLLTARELVFGKLGAAVIYLLLLIFTTLPLQSLAFILGGVGLAETLIASFMLVVTAIFYCSLGLFFSCLLKRTLAATITSYSSILLSILALVLFVFMIGMLESFLFGTYYGGANNNPVLENIAVLIMWIFVSTNSILTVIISEAILIDQQSLFITNSPLFGGTTMTLPSPWIIYVILYTILTMFLVFMSIRLVQRPEH